MPKVLFVPQQKLKEIKTGATILAAANQCKIPIGQSCDGDGICGWCRVTIVDGGELLSHPSTLERRLMEEKSFAPDERAACLARIQGDVSVTAPYW